MIESLLGNQQLLLILIFVVLLIAIVVSIVKKAIKTAVFIAIMLAINAYLITAVNKFNDEFGFKYKNGVVTVDNRYNTGIAFKINDIQSVNIDKNKSNDTESTIVVTLRSGATVDFKIGSHYEGMARDIINKK